jgi:hypothetical protein
MDDNEWCQHDIMGVLIMELHNSWKLIILIDYNWVVMSWIIYIVSCNSATHATCLLALIANKYNEL